MSDKLNLLNGKTAEEILRMSGQLQSVPVDLERIIDKLELYKYPRTFQDIEDMEKKQVIGLVLSSENNIGIFYDINASVEQKRFIIAHEIGHCCLHGDMLKDGYIEFLHEENEAEDAHEAEANLFAARLLIPEQSLINIYNKLILPSLAGLSDIFEVPPFLMRLRLGEMQLKYYIDERDEFIKP